LAYQHSRSQCTAVRLYVLSVPTRRSSDLSKIQQGGYPLHFNPFGRFKAAYPHLPFPSATVEVFPTHHVPVNGAELIVEGNRVMRSEEHTSELQSRENLVCRLQLEKKKSTY